MSISENQTLREPSKPDNRGAETVSYGLRDVFITLILGAPLLGAFLLTMGWFMHGAAAKRAADEAFVQTVASLDLAHALIEDRSSEIVGGRFFKRPAKRITGIMVHTSDEDLVWSYCLYDQDDNRQVFVAFDARETLGVTSRRILGSQAAHTASPAALEQCRSVAL